MSKVAWCDYGKHAFKAGDPGSASFDASEIDGDGNTVRTTLDACGEHNPLATHREAARFGLTEKAYTELNEEKSE